MDESQRMLELLNDSFPDIASMSPHDAREAVDARVRPPSNLGDVASAEDETIVTPEGELRVRVYRPHTRRPATPTTVFAHGGGFLHGSIHSHDGFCRRWSRRTESPVVSVQYRLAPEHRGPAPVDDIVAAIDWVHSSGLAPAGVVVAGDSSGGNLAAASAITLRDRGDSPLVGQVLIYPMLDPRMESETYRSRAEGYFITARFLRYYWETYLGDRIANAADDWRICPLAATSLAGLPPAVVVTAGLDPLSSEGRRYADRLRSDGGRVLHRHYPDQFHGFLTIPGYGPGASASEILWSDMHRIFTQNHVQENS